MEDLGIKGLRFRTRIQSRALLERMLFRSATGLQVQNRSRKDDQDTTCEVEVGMMGRHAVTPALAAIAVGLHEGLGLV